MFEETIVNTSYGKVKGEKVGGVYAWKGIPYAKPPVGLLRFCPPEQPDAWKGIYEATKFGLSAMQPRKTVITGDKGDAVSEDCLYLNVWSKGIGDKLRPVMVWIHGGSYMVGSGYDGLYDGTSFAQEGDVVVVTINYRLGAFGFLYLGDIAGKKYKASGNCGLLDQIAALKWVKENIKAFGGDPDKVTIFGESAGAGSIGNLLVMPGAKGLFNQAIIESAPNLAIDTDKAARVTKEIMNSLNIKSDEFEKLLELPAEEILNASLKLPRKSLYPVVDGITIPEVPEKMMKKGAAKGIPIICGSNKDEFKLFTGMNPMFNKMTDNEIHKQLEEQFGELWTELYDYFSKVGINKETYNRIMSYYFIIYPTLKYSEILSENSPVYVYKFNHEHPVLGAFHALELPYVWHKFDTETSELFRVADQDTKLADKMHHAWIAFAKNGNPNTEELPYWPEFNIEKREVMVFDNESKVENDPYEDREIWDKISLERLRY